MRLIRPQSANEGMMAEKGSIGRAAVMPTSGAARSLPARDVSSPDRLSIVVSRTGSRDLEFPSVFFVNGSMRAASFPAGPVSSLSVYSSRGSSRQTSSIRHTCGKLHAF